ncbi:MAG: hypothetical protein ACI9SE_002796, partial [Neolewinella sp.]
MNHLPTRPPVVTAQSEPKHTGLVVRASHRALASLVLLFAFAMGSSAVAQGGGNLIQDGGFENFGITPGTASYQSSYGAWNTVQGTVALLGTPYGGVPVYEGTAVMHVGNSYGTGYVEQTFATTIGKRYRLSFAIVDYQGGATSVQATVSGAGGTDLSASCAAPGGNVWFKHELVFVASGSSSVLRIQNVQGASSIDDVQCRDTNLLQDGGFENLGVAPGVASYQAAYGAWNTVQGTVALLGMPYGGLPSYEGAAVMHVGDNFGTGFVEQTFATTIGSTYCLSFAVVDWNGGATSVQATISGTGGTDLSANCAAPGGSVWLKHTLSFVASSSSSVLRIENVQGASTIDDVHCVAALPEIELSFTTDTTFQWNDAGCGISGEFHFWRPDVPASAPDFHTFGSIGRFGPTVPVAGMIVGKDLSGSAFASPVSYTQMWNDQSTNCVDVSFWRPEPPPGYVSLGSVCTVYNTYPQPNEAICVRADLCVLASAGDAIYYGTAGGSYHLGTYDVVAPPGAIDVGCFVVSSSGAPPSPIYCIKASVVQELPAPTQAELASAISAHGPILQLHSSEAFLPDDPDFVLNAPGTAVLAELVDQGYSTFNEQFLSGTTVGTSASTILNDVQPSLSHPLTGDPEFLYRLNYNQNLAGGDLNRAKAYVRVQPIDGIITELQFWVFYPWNGPGKSEAGCGSLPTVVFNPTGANGSHFSDWENVRVRVTNKSLQNPGNYELVSVVMSRHSTEEEVDAANLIYAIGRPVIYVAKDSHAHYPSPGTHYYERVASLNIGLCLAHVDLFDLTNGNNANQLHCYHSSKYQIVSSAWPSVATSTPDWFFFGGQWGGFGLHSFSVTAFGQTLHTETEVANGKPGLLRRNEFAVPQPINANLGRLFADAGVVSPAFVPQGSNYEMTVPTSASTISLTALAEAHNAVVVIDCNGTSYPVASGALYGLATSIPLVQGLNTCEVTVTVAGATRTYD